MGLAILGIVVLLYIVLAYFAAKTWQVWHVVVLVFLFLFSLGFLILSAATLRVQDRWRSRYESLVTQLENEQDTNEVLIHGSILEGELGEPALRGQARRAMVDRGRVWRNLRLADLGNGQVLLNTIGWDSAGCRSLGAAEDADEFDAGADDAGDAQDGAAPAAAAPAPLGLEQDAVVFAFKETPIAGLPQPVLSILFGEESDLATRDTRGLCKVPTFYLGEFKVIGDPNANPGTLTLEPTVPLTDSQLEQIEAANSTWVLYEVMPVDSHDVFADLTAEQLGILIASSEAEGIPWQQVIDQYVRDGEQATDMDPPERQQLLVRFLQAHTEDVDVQVEGDIGQQPLPDNFFDPNGRSLVPTLNQGEKTQFERGDEVVFDHDTAQQLIADGKAELVKRIYSRRLRDYAHAFRSITGELEGLDRQVAAAESDLQKLNESITQLNDQIAFETQQRDKLDFDRKGISTELQALTAYRDALEAKWTQLRAELSRLYRSNRQLASTLSAR